MKKNLLLAIAIFIELVGIFLIVKEPGNRSGMIFISVGLVFLIISVVARKKA